MHLSDLCLTTPPSGIRLVFNRIAELKDVISFAVGEPDFPTPQPIIDAACRAFQAGHTHYTPNAGLYMLRQAIADSYSSGTCCPEQIVVTAGGTEALLLTLLTLINPGDEVILAEPYWPTYLGQIKACGAIPRFVRTYEKDQFSLKPDQVQQAITDKTRLIIINSPANPTGAVIPRQDLEALAGLAQKHDLMVISDEVYKQIIYGRAHSSIADIEGMRERCIVIDSFSKGYAMTGWRIGYALAPLDIARAMTNMHEYSVSCISAPAQMAAVIALKDCGSYVNEMMNEFDRRRHLVVDGIQKIKGLSCFCPAATFYLYFNIAETGLDANQFVYSLLEQKKVALAPGPAFGNGQEAYVRLCYANSQANLLEGLSRIEDFVNAL